MRQRPWRSIGRWVVWVIGGAAFGAIIGWLAAAWELHAMDVQLAPEGKHVCGAAVGAFIVGFPMIGATFGAISGAFGPLLWRLIRPTLDRVG